MQIVIGNVLSADEIVLVRAALARANFEDGRETKFQAPIVIGERVWVSTRVVVLKGVVLGNDVVVAAGTVLTRPLPESNVLVGGSPARVLRTGVSWSQGR